MQRLLDVYTVLAGDAAAAYAGRGFNMRLGRWETVSGGNLSNSRLTTHRLKDADFIVSTSAGAVKVGTVIRAFVVNDPSHPELSTPWFDGVIAKRNGLYWHGDMLLAAGFFWRVISPGLDAGDIVTMGVGYE